MSGMGETSGVTTVSGVSVISGVTTVSGEGVTTVEGGFSAVGLFGVGTSVFVPGSVAMGVFVFSGVIKLLSVQEDKQNADIINTATIANIDFFILISFDIQKYR